MFIRSSEVFLNIQNYTNFNMKAYGFITYPEAFVSSDINMENKNQMWLPLFLPLFLKLMQVFFVKM